MAERNTGGPAFPGSKIKTDRDVNFTSADKTHPGMTLRDYFAIHSYIADTKFPNLEIAAKFLGEPVPDDRDFIAVVNFGARLAARLRYIAADAMIAERERDEPK